MLSGQLRAAIEADISRACGAAFHIRGAAPAAGGCIHRSLRIEGETGRYFAKINAAEFSEAFAAEADGLAALREAGMRAPRPLCAGSAAGQAYLVMEYLELGRGGDWAAMGRGLAAMHRASRPRFGWRRDNFIGSTPQPNPGHQDWAAFWREARLAPQLALARRNGLGARLIERGERLAESVSALLRDHSPEPSLLHGDLWSGNAGFAADGVPVLFDPAVYCGDREADLAMTELFGGFPRAFYAAYTQAWPLDPGYERRRELYNLYHVLNHANLFGGGYASQAASLIERLLAQARE